MKRRVLIVDDDAVFRRQLASELDRYFLEPVQAGDIPTALALAAEQSIDVVLVDVRLGEADGLALVESIKKQRPQSEVVVITGYGSTAVAIQALRAGAIDFIEKPIQRKDLDAALGRALERISNNEQVSAKPTVLVIDDDVTARDAVAQILGKEGFHVLTAESGEAGLRHVAASRVDVLITDMRLPAMNGVEVLRRAKADFEDIQGIIITGYEDHAAALEALRQGASDYLIKPLDLQVLLHSVTRAVERQILSRNLLYRNRELKIHAQIFERMKVQLEEELDVRTEKLKQTQAQLFQASKLATLGEMAAGIAHELNQPLSGIALASRHLRKLRERGLLDLEEMDLALEDIDTSIKRVTAVIDHVRTFARQDKLQYREVALNHCVQSALKLVGEQLRARGIELIENLSPDLPLLIGEPYQIEQVILNLLSNARDAVEHKASRPGKSASKQITLTTRALQCEDGRPGVSIACHDNGTGISAEDLPCVFDPFFTTKEPGSGTGLGLAISFGIVEGHGGRITVESEPGVHTTFQIWLPLEGKGDEGGAHGR